MLVFLVESENPVLLNTSTSGQSSSGCSLFLFPDGLKWLLSIRLSVGLFERNSINYGPKQLMENGGQSSSWSVENGSESLKRLIQQND